MQELTKVVVFVLVQSCSMFCCHGARFVPSLHARPMAFWSHPKNANSTKVAVAAHHASSVRPFFGSQSSVHAANGNMPSHTPSAPFMFAQKGNGYQHLRLRSTQPFHISANKVRVDAARNHHSSHHMTQTQQYENQALAAMRNAASQKMPKYAKSNSLTSPRLQDVDSDEFKVTHFHGFRYAGLGPKADLGAFAPSTHKCVNPVSFQEGMARMGPILKKEQQDVLALVSGDVNGQDLFVDGNHPKAENALKAGESDARMLSGVLWDNAGASPVVVKAATRKEWERHNLIYLALKTNPKANLVLAREGPAKNDGFVNALVGQKGSDTLAVNGEIRQINVKLRAVRPYLFADSLRPVTVNLPVDESKRSNGQNLLPIQKSLIEDPADRIIRQDAALRHTQSGSAIPKRKDPKWLVMQRVAIEEPVGNLPADKSMALLTADEHMQIYQAYDQILLEAGQIIYGDKERLTDTDHTAPTAENLDPNNNLAEKRNYGDRGALWNYMPKRADHNLCLKVDRLTKIPSDENGFILDVTVWHYDFDDAKLGSELYEDDFD